MKLLIRLLIGVLIMLIVVSMGIIIMDAEKINYKMPNGVVCKSQSFHVGKTTFTACSDGQTYLNPESYFEIR